MTDQEWRACSDLQRMIDALRPFSIARKERLFLCACCRHFDSILDYTEAAATIDFAERLADHPSLVEEAQNVQRTLWNQHPLEGSSYEEFSEICANIWASPFSVYSIAILRSMQTQEASWDLFADYLRCIFGNPFPKPDRPNILKTAAAGFIKIFAGSPMSSAPRPSEVALNVVECDPRWLTSSVLDLATGIYEDHAFNRMPILADALMDSGCANEDIIAHSRGDGPHVRGCWVVDLILGKT